MHKIDHERWGQIEVIELGTEVLKSKSRGTGVTVQKSRYSWGPCARIAKQFNPDFAVHFDCYRDADGNRRFLPIAGAWYYINLAFQAGRAIERERDSLSDARTAEIDVLWHCYLRMGRTREKLDRRFDTKADLQIRLEAREQAGLASVLPLQLGSSPAQPNVQWTISQLLENGKLRAQQDGYQNISQASSIQYGLLAAAELNPLIVPESECAALIRLALYDVETVDSVTAEIVDRLLNRIRQGQTLHEQDTHEEFMKWFTNNPFKYLAATAGQELEKLDRSQVHSALHELGWRAHHSVARCLTTFAQAFAASLQEPLNAEEQVLFAATFEPQGYFGNLPLLMLLDRGPLIKPIITKMWQDPHNLRLRDILWRLFQYYSEMVSPRRAADRRAKQAKSVTKTLPLDRAPAKQQEGTERQTSTKAAKDEYAGLVHWKHLLEKLGIACSHPGCTQIPLLLEHKMDSFRMHLLKCTCPDHGNLDERKIPHDVFLAANPNSDN